MEQFAQLLNDSKKQRFLDVCSGPGNFYNFVTQVYDGYEELIGIDTMERMVQIANQSKPNDRVRYELGDVYAIPFEDESFDVVSLQYSLHHLDRVEDALKEMARVLKPDGFIVVNEMLREPLEPAQISHRKLHHFAAAIDRAMGDVHNDTYSKEEVINLLQPCCNLYIDKLWELNIPPREETTAEELAQFNAIIDRLLTRIPDGVDKAPFEAEAQAIKEYIQQHGYDGATNVMAILRKQ